MIRSKFFIKKAVVAVALSAALISGNIAFNLPSLVVTAEAGENIDDVDPDEMPESPAVGEQGDEVPSDEKGDPLINPDDLNPDEGEPEAADNTDDAALLTDDAAPASDDITDTPDEEIPAQPTEAADDETPAQDENSENVSDPENGTSAIPKNEPAETPEVTENPDDPALSNNAEDPTATEGAGETTTEKPKLTLKSQSLAKVYDGKPLENGIEPLEIEEGWLEGDGADYKFTTSITTGYAFNTFEVIPWEGTDLDDYEVEIGFGDLNVIEREGDLKYILTVTGVSGETKYSGSEQTLSGFVVNGRSYSEFRIEASGDPNESIGFTIGDAAFTVSGISASVTAKDAGTHFLNISGAPVVRDSSGADVTDEFQFEYFAGKFTINPREVTLKSASDKKKYDGKALRNHEVTISGDGFAEGEGVTYKFTGQQKEVGESFNYFTYVMNEGTLESNYDITVVPGKLKVKEADKKPDNNQGSSGSEESGDNTGSDSSGSAASSSASNSTSAELTNDTAGEVLGAKRGANIAKAVVGARNSATDDPATDWYGRVLVMAACMMLTTIIWGKKKKNE